MKRRQVQYILACLCVPLAGWLAGCGGSGSPEMRGSLAITVNWPPRTAGLLPRDAQSARVAISSERGQLLATKLITRQRGIGSETVQFADLLPGSVTVEVTAHVRPDGSDPAISTGSTRAAILAGHRTTIPVSMNSTVKSVVLSLDPIPLNVGAQVTVTATAKDDATPTPNMLLVTSFDLWVSGDTGIAQLSPVRDAMGVVKTDQMIVTAVAPGQTLLTVREEASRVTGSAVVIVAPPAVASVLVTPNPLSLLAGGTGQMTATARDAQGRPILGAAFTWSSSDTTVAAVDTNGNISAGSGGSATITATEKSSGVSGSAIVNVNGNVTG